MAIAADDGVVTFSATSGGSGAVCDGVHLRWVLRRWRGKGGSIEVDVDADFVWAVDAEGVEVRNTDDEVTASATSVDCRARCDDVQLEADGVEDKEQEMMLASISLA